MTDIKPWDLLNPWTEQFSDDITKKWWIASNNELSQIEDMKFNTIKAIFIIQDGNMAGNYFRYFYWIEDSNKRNCVITSKWIFNESLDKFTNNKIIEKDSIKFIVNDKFNDKYVKLLTKIN